MSPSILRLFIFCNVTIGVYLLHGLLPYPHLLISLIVNLLIYIVPGSAWLGILSGRIKDPVMLSVFTVAFSLIVWCISILILSILGLPKTPLNFIFCGFMLTNAGLFIFRRHDITGIYLAEIFNSSEARRLSGLLIGAFVAVYSGAAIYSPGIDHDYEVPGAAPGMIDEFQPLFAYNHPETTFYFAHPPLAIVNIGLGALFMDRLPDFQFYKISSKAARQVLRGTAGDVVVADYPESFIGGGQTKVTIRNIDGSLLHITEENTAGKLTDILSEESGWSGAKKVIARSDKSITYELGRWRISHFFFQHDVQKFKQMDALLLMRVGNLMITAMLFVMIFQFAQGMTGSNRTAFLIAAAYLLSTGIFIRSVMAGHVAVSEFAIFSLIYQAWLLRDKPIFEWVSNPIWLLPGIYAAWADQKTVIVPLAIGAFAGVKFLIESRTLHGLIEAFKRAAFNSVVFGWGLGMGLYIVYGCVVSAGQFYNFFIRIHGIDRLNLTPDEYITTLPQFYFDTLIEAPLIFVTIALLLIAMARLKHEIFSWQWGVATTVICVGLIGFSIIDWRYSKQLMTIVPACAFIAPFLLSCLDKYQRLFSLIAIFAILVFGLVANVAIGIDFEMYKPANDYW